MENQLENLQQLVTKYEFEGQHDLAVRVCETTLRDLKQVKGMDHQDVADVSNILVQVYLNQINYNKSEFRTSDVIVSVTLTKLGDFYCELKRFEEAETVYHRALVINEKIYKENDPDIEKVLCKLASACKHQAKYDMAELYLRESLMICEKIGKLEVARTTLDLGNLYMQAGFLKEAEEIYNEALNIFISKLKPRALSIAHTKYNLAMCYLKQERFQEAEPHFKEASISYESNREDLHLADSHLGLGCCFLNRNKYEVSKKHLKIALKILIEPPHDSKDVKVAEVKFNLGLCFSMLHQNQKAESAFLHSLTIYNGKLKPQDLLLAEPMFHLANCLMLRGQHKGAEEYFVKALALHEKNPLIGKLKAVDTKCCLIMCLTKQGRYQEANQHLKQACTHGQENVNLPTVQFDLGNCFLDTGNYEESVELYQDALRIFEKQENDLMVADIKYNLALGLTQLNRIEEARGFYLDALSIYTKELEPNDTHLCDVKINLANCYVKLEEWKNAQEHFMMVLEVFKSGLGFDDLVVAEIEKNVGLCFFNQKCFKEALIYFQNASLLLNLATDEKIIVNFMNRIADCSSEHASLEYFVTSLFTPYSIKSAEYKSILGDCYLEHEKFTEAEKCYQESVEFYKSMQGDMSSHIAEELRKLDYCLKEQGTPKQAEESTSQGDMNSQESTRRNKRGFWRKLEREGRRIIKKI